MPAPIAPFDCFVGLLTTAGYEVAGNGYARQAATFSYAVDGINIANVSVVQWPMATGNWGTIDHVQLWSEPVGGPLVTGGSTLPTTEVVYVAQYALARIRPAGITTVQGHVPRPYGVGGYGTGPYGTRVALLPGTLSVLLEVAFDATGHVCGDAVWTPSAPCAAGVWTASHACSPGTWA